MSILDKITEGDSISSTPKTPITETASVTTTGNTGSNAPPIDWQQAFHHAMNEGANLASLEIAPRPSLMGAWMKEGDLGMIYAARGVGKTWLSMMLAHALAEGRGLGEWEAGEQGPGVVVYVDGEMNLADTVAREQQMKAMGFQSVNLTFLHHEQLPEGRHLNLADVGQQEALLAEAKARGAKAVVLDNISCLFRDVDENDNNEWEKVSPWLLSFRRAGVAVVLIHHEGRNGGGARGASRREDMMHWVIRLEGNSVTTGDDGASFSSSFTKCRNCPGRDAPPLEWRVGNEAVECERADDVEQLVALVRDGFSDCGEIADCTGWSKSRVSKLARRAMNAGRLEKSGRKYKIPG
jgi:hypothetical protein